MVPSLVVTQPRTLFPSYIHLNQYSGSLVEQVYQYWQKNHFLQSFLDTAPPNEASTWNGVLPFMGLPVLGTYQLALNNPPTGCSYDDANFYLEVAYASDPRLAN